MRVITGSVRGRKLTTPVGMDVRPTLDKVKEGLFSSVQFEIEGRRVLDLFAGSGQLGIEALSRGASHCVFVDSAKPSLNAIRQNLSLCGMESCSTVIAGDAFSFISSCRDRFGIVFLDPPYRQHWIDRCLPYVVSCMQEGGFIVCETDADEELPGEAGEFRIDKCYRYSKTKITVYRHQ